MGYIGILLGLLGFMFFLAIATIFFVMGLVMGIVGVSRRGQPRGAAIVSLALSGAHLVLIAVGFALLFLRV